MTTLLPLAYGYIREGLLHDRDQRLSEDQLRKTTSSLGYELGTVFREPAPENGLLPPAFVDLVQECLRAEVRAVITPHGHMPDMSVCRMVLEVRAHAAVHEVEF
jgi:hypothetical protein